MKKIRLLYDRPVILHTGQFFRYVPEFTCNRRIVGSIARLHFGRIPSELSPATRAEKISSLHIWRGGSVQGRQGAHLRFLGKDWIQHPEIPGVGLKVGRRSARMGSGGDGINSCGLKAHL